MSMTKTCTKCEKPKLLNEFYNGRNGARSICKECCNLEYQQRRLNKMKSYNPDELRTCSKCKTTKKASEFTINQSQCKKCIKEWARNWRETNPDYRLNTKKYEAKIKRLNTPVYQRMKLIGKLRARIRMALKTGSHKKCTSTTILLGCTIPELKTYLESKFTAGMSWELIDTGKIHIDHIKPCSSFNLGDPQQQKICFHYTNLQPLWASDNLSKGSKLSQAQP